VRAKSRVDAKMASDQMVTLPKRLMMSLEQRMKIAMKAMRHNIASSAQSRMGRSVGRRRFLKKPPMIHTGA